MNARTLRLLQEMFGAVVVCVALSLLMSSLPHPVNLLALHLLPLVWLGLRHGGASSIVAAAFAGVIFTFAQWQDNFVASILLNLSPLLWVGLAGFFAKYTQKTLNNRRLSSTYLNISTASTLVSVTYGLTVSGFKTLLIGTPLSVWSGATWLSIIATSVVLSIVLCTMAKLNDKLIIPKRTKYLSRKETTSLLN